MRTSWNENHAVLRGTAAAEPVFSHTNHGVDFFVFPLSVPRLSGTEDRLNVVVPQPLLTECPPTSGRQLEVTGEVRGDWLVLQAFSQVIGQQLRRKEKLHVLEQLAAAWAGRPLRIAFRPPQKIVRTEAELKEEIQQHPVIRKFQDVYDARLVRCTPINR